jgi:cytochrome c-type biogenesis protein CcmH/NrfF
VRKHALDWFSLLAGLVFVTVAIVHLAAASTTHDTDVRWVFPVAMVLVGLGSLISLVRRDRDQQLVERPDQQLVGETEDTPADLP